MKLRLLSLFTFFCSLASLAQTPPTTSGLVGYWPFNETTGATASDASGSGYHGTLVNNPTWSPGGGRISGGLEMADNTGRYVNIPGLTWQPTAFTVSWWMNPYTYNGWCQAMGSSIGWGGFIFHSSSAGEVYVGTDVNTRFYLGGGTVQLNKWQHFTFSYANGVGKFYKNGQLLASRSGMTAPSAWGGMFLGSTDPGGALHGKIDELRIYNRALSDGEVSNIAAYPLGALAAVWKADAPTTDWHTAGNWLQGVVPGPEAEVTINACSACPVLASDVTIDRLKLEGGSLNLNGKTLSTQSLRLAQSTLNSNGGSIQTNNSEWFYQNSIYGAFTYRMAGGNMRGGNTFYGPFNLLLSTSGWLAGWGGANVFKDKVLINNTGGGWFYVNGDQYGMVFEKEVELRNEGHASIYFPDNGTLTFKEAVTINNHSARYIGVGSGVGSAAVFEGPVVVNNTARDGLDNNHVGLCNSTFYNSVTVSNTVTHFLMGISIGGEGRPCTFKPTASLQIGSNGYTRGYLNLSYTTHENTGLGTFLHMLNVSAEHPRLTIGPAVVFSGEVDVKAPDVKLNGATFQKAAKIERYGYSYGTAPFNLGGNVFNGPTTLINSGGNDWYFGHNAKDVFNGDLTIHQSTGVMKLAYWNAGHEFNGNVTMNIADGSGGVIFFGEGGGTSRLKEGKTLTASRFNNGALVLNNFTQAGSTPQTLTLEGSAIAYLGRESRFEAPLTVTAPQLYLNGTSLYKPSVLIKTGSGYNYSLGGNTFYSKVKILNQAATGIMNLATESPDVFLPAPAN